MCCFSCLASVEYTTTQDLVEENFLRMNHFFPVCLVVLKYFISLSHSLTSSSEIGYCQSVFAKKIEEKKRSSKRLCKHLEEAPAK